MKSEEFFMPHGRMDQNANLSIKTNARIKSYFYFKNIKPCKHCHSIKQQSPNNREWICPRLIVAEDLTADDPLDAEICLDCILEFAENLP